MIELLPHKAKQTNEMTICEAPDRVPQECGHWYSPNAVEKLIQEACTIKQKEIADLAAQIEMIRAVPLGMRCEAEGNSRRGKCEPVRAIVLRDVANKLERILSITPIRSPSQAEGE